MKDVPGIKLLSGVAATHDRSRRQAIGAPLVFLVAGLARSLDAQSRDPKLRAQYQLEKPNVKSLSNLSSEQMQLIEKLNRCDAEHLAQLPILVSPSDWSLDESSHSPWPPQLRSTPVPAKLLIVHVPSQAFGGYESGTLVRWGPISSGRAAHPTPAGDYHLNWRSRGRYSTDNPSWFLEWYYNFENLRGLSFHAYALPGYPASHGCVRLLKRDARWLYEWGEGWTLSDPYTLEKAGTPVHIIGEYAFNQPPPWRSPIWLQSPTTI